MGKGYEANSLSSKTLEFIDKITSSQMESSTYIQIINTFYLIYIKIPKKFQKNIAIFSKII